MPSIFTQTSGDPSATGDTVIFTLSITDDVTNAFGFNAVLNYDADVLLLTAATFEDPFPFGIASGPEIPTDASGPQSLGTFSGGLLGVVPAGSDFITFEFEVIAQGDTTVSLTDNGVDPFVALDGGGELPPPAGIDLSIQPNSGNSDPVALDDSASTDEGVAVDIDVLDNDSDADSDTLRVSAVGAASHGTVTQNADDTLTYTPDSDFSGEDSFEYTVSDDNGGTDTATVTIDVAPDSPVGSAVFAQTTPDPTAVGNTISYTLSITDDVTEAFGFNAVLNYDADVLRLTAATFEDPFPFGIASGPEIPTDASGPQSLGTFVGGLLAVVPAGSDFITFEFEVIAQGDTTVSLTDNGNDPFVALDGGGELPPPAGVDFNFNFAPDAVDDTATTDEDTAFEIDVLENDSDPGDAEPTIASFGQGANGTVTSTEDGLTYDPDDNFNGTDSFTYTVEDGDGEQATATVNVIVNAVNDAPTGAVTISGTAQEGETLTASNDLADVDGLGPISYQWRADGFDIAGADTDMLVLGPDEVGAQITAVASYTDGDGEGESVESAATAEVAEVFPTQTGTVTLVQRPGPTSIGNTIEIDIMASDMPAISGFQADLSYDADVLSLTGVDYLSDFDFQSPVSEPADASGPTIVENVSGSEFDDPSQISGSFVAATLSFDVKSIGPITIELLPVLGSLFIDDNNQDIDIGGPVTLELVLNTDPDADPLSVSGNEDTVISGIVTATDVDGDPLTFALEAGPAHGSVTVNPGGTFDYTPDADYNGPDSFTYEVDDGNGGTATGTVSITVAAVNDDPVATALGVSGDEDTVISGIVTASDVDSDPLTFALEAGPAHGSVTVNPGGTFEYTPDADYNGSDSFTYEVDDGNGGTATGTVSITVDPVNDAPTGAPAITGTTTAGETLTAVVGTLADADGLGAFSYQWFANGTPISGATGETYLLTEGNIDATMTVQVFYEDGGGTNETAVSGPTVPIADSNEPPVAADDTATTNEDTPVTLDVLDNDTDPDGGAPAPDEVLYRVNVGGPALTVTGGLDWGGDTGSFGNAGNSPYLFDNSGGGSTYTSSTGGSHAGPASATDPSIPAGTPGDIFQTERYDVDSAPEMQWKFPVQTDFGLVAGDEVIVRLYFAELFGGIDAAGERVFDVSVEGAVPAAFDDIDPFATAGANAGFMLDSVATIDGDGTLDLELIHGVENPALKGIEILQAGAPTAGNDNLTVAIDTGPTNGSVGVNADGTITYTPSGDYSGPDSFVYEITDADGATDTATVDVTVAAVNDDPVATALSVSGNEDTVISGIVTATDVDGDPLTFALAAGPTYGDVTVNENGTFAYTPNANFNGSDSFTYAVDDGNGGTDTETVSITVTAVNDDPVAAATSVSGDEDTVISGTVTASDVDGDPLTFALAAGPSNGSVTFNGDNTFEYTPGPDYNGLDSFTYEVDDGNGGTATGTVSITVDPVNDAPELTVGDEFDFLDSASGPVFTASATDVDVGDTLTFSLGGTDAGSFDIDETSGAVTLSATAPPEFTIADGDIGSIADVTQNLDLIVSVSDGTATVDQAVTVNFLKDTDGDGFADANDNALFVANPDQRDTDGDGYGNIIDADLNNDGVVLVNDVFLFRAAFNLSSLTDGVDVEANADFTGDGAVNGADVAIFRDLYGQDIETQSLIGDDYSTVA